MLFLFNSPCSVFYPLLFGLGKKKFAQTEVERTISSAEKILFLFKNPSTTKFLSFTFLVLITSVNNGFSIDLINSTNKLYSVLINKRE